MLTRETVDLTSYPDLIVIYLGMRVNAPKGLVKLLKIGPQIQRAVAQQPDGLLRHEFFAFSIFPPHVGMRQYWRDFDSLERWARSLPHRGWWGSFLREEHGTGFWHETYSLRGGIEAIYDGISVPLGLRAFAPIHAARGPMFGSRSRLHAEGTPNATPAVEEHELYSP